MEENIKDVVNGELQGWKFERDQEAKSFMEILEHQSQECIYVEKQRVSVVKSQEAIVRHGRQEKVCCDV